MAVRRVHSKGDYRTEEYIAAEAGIYPGMLLKIGASGVTAHDDEGGRGAAIFAVESALNGVNVDTVYASGARVFAILPTKGAEVYAMIEDAQNVAIGSELISAGNGKLKLRTDVESGETDEETIAIGAEAKDLTGSNTDDSLARVIII